LAAFFADFFAGFLAGFLVAMTQLRRAVAKLHEKKFRLLAI
jgi:hypothetical protein